MYLGRKIAAIVVVIVAILAIGGIWFFWDEEEPTPPPECGDGYCDPEYETPENCPEDCGCNYNGICEPERGETAANCPDCVEPICNNNGICEPELGENCQNCPEDCGPCQQDVSVGLGFRRPLVPVSNSDTFWMTVYYVPSTDAPLRGFKFNLGYDPSILEYQQISPSTNWETWWYLGDTSVSGVITDVQSFYPDCQTTKGNLFSIQFKAISVGTTPLSFTYLEAMNCNSEYITLNYTDNTIEIK